MGDNLSFESSDEHHVQDDEMLLVDNDGIEDFSWVRNDIDDTTVTPRNLYRYKLEKIIMTGIFIGISYENNNDNSIS